MKRQVKAFEDSSTMQKQRLWMHPYRGVSNLVHVCENKGHVDDKYLGKGNKKLCHCRRSNEGIVVQGAR